MDSKKEALREIPKTNYFILAGIVILIICLCSATFNVVRIYKEYKLGKVSPLNISKEVDFSELSSAINEMSEDTFFVISYSGDEDIYQNEKNLKIIFRKNELLDNIIYVDVTEEMEKDGFYDEINSSLGLSGDLKITTVPTIVYFKEGTVKAIAKSKNGIVDSENLKTIIEKNINVG